MNKGTVKFYQKAKGFGFIIPEGEEGNDVFVHHSGCNDELEEGDSVTYDTEDTPKGAKAINVSVAA